jgi:hypothetical protein
MPDQNASNLAKLRWAKTTPAERSEQMRRVRAGSAKKRGKSRKKK